MLFKHTLLLIFVISFLELQFHIHTLKWNYSSKSKMFRPITTKERINPEGLLDTESGELLESNNSSLQLIRETETDCFLVHSDNYIILDVNALELIKPFISYSDFGALMFISQIITRNYNV